MIEQEKKRIENWIQKYLPRISSQEIMPEYWINDDLSVDVYGDTIILDLDTVNFDLTNGLPIQFGTVEGNFYLHLLAYEKGNPTHKHYLNTLKGCPKRVGGDFEVIGTSITNLHFAPQYVSNNFNCCANQIISLEGVPKFIGNDFWYDGGSPPYNPRKFTVEEIANFYKTVGYGKIEGRILTANEVGKM